MRSWAGRRHALVAGCKRRRLAAPRRITVHDRRSGRPPRRARQLERRRRLLRVGRPRKPSGSTRPVVAWTAPATHGATSCSTATAVWRVNVWQGTFPPPTTLVTATSPQRPCGRTHPTASACGRPSATCGSGALTGTTRRTTGAPRGTTPRAQPGAPPGLFAAAHSSATTRTATAIAKPPGRPTPRTRRPPTRASAPSRDAQGPRTGSR
jgi:hypothetical protein